MKCSHILHSVIKKQFKSGGSKIIVTAKSLIFAIIGFLQMVEFHPLFQLIKKNKKTKKTLHFRETQQSYMLHKGKNSNNKTPTKISIK